MIDVIAAIGTMWYNIHLRSKIIGGVSGLTLNALLWFLCLAVPTLVLTIVET